MSAPTTNGSVTDGVLLVVVLLGVGKATADAGRDLWFTRASDALSRSYPDPSVKPVEVDLDPAEARHSLALTCYVTDRQARDPQAAGRLGTFLRAFADSASDRRAAVVLGSTYFEFNGRRPPSTATGDEPQK